MWLCCAVLSRSVCVRLFVTPWTVAHQTPLSMGILQARILGWVARSSSRDLPNPGMELRSPALQMDSLPSEPPGKPKLMWNQFQMDAQHCSDILLYFPGWLSLLFSTILSTFSLVLKSQTYPSSFTLGRWSFLLIFRENRNH